MTVRGTLTTLLAGAALALGACGGTESGGTESGGGEDRVAAIEHIHGLGVNPKDQALFVATHDGLLRSNGSEFAAVGEEHQDTMGFTVIGPDRFLGSGHPAPDEQGAPANLGLIESTDAGKSWEDVALAGEVDFHVLRYSDETIYAVDALSGRLMISEDGGSEWAEATPPAPVIDLAIDPEDSGTIVVATERGLAISEDRGGSWRPLGSEIGLLAWPSSDQLLLVDANGRVQTSDGQGKAWRELGEIGGSPAAFTAASAEELYAATTDGAIVATEDGGASWQER